MHSRPATQLALEMADWEVHELRSMMAGLLTQLQLLSRIERGMASMPERSSGIPRTATELAISARLAWELFQENQVRALQNDDYRRRSLVDYREYAAKLEALESTGPPEVPTTAGRPTPSGY